jgi:hypothetical protein
LADSGISLDRSDQPLQARFQERHFAVGEVAELWNLCPDVVRKLFEREPGVLVLGDHGSRGKRRYTTLRIPQSVVERVHRRLCNPDLTTESRKRRVSSSRDHQLPLTTDGP